MHAQARGVMRLDAKTCARCLVRVYEQGSDDWEVELELQLIETYLGGTIKKIKFSYPVHIVRYDVGKRNPWKLALDGYTREPEKIMERVDGSK